MLVYRNRQFRIGRKHPLYGYCDTVTALCYNLENAIRFRQRQLLAVVKRVDIPKKLGQQPTTQADALKWGLAKALLTSLSATKCRILPSINHQHSVCSVNTRYGSAQAVQRVQATYNIHGKGSCDLVHEAEQTLAMGELRRETDRTLSYLS